METPHTFECPLAVSAQAFPVRIALRDSHRCYTFLESDREVARYCAFLLNLNISPQQRLAVVSENSVELVFLQFAAMRVGLSLVFLNLRQNAHIWKQQLTLSEASVLFYQEKLLSQVASIELPKIELSCLAEVCESQFPQPRILLASSECSVVFTSGSSGVGKGVRLSVANHLLAAEASNNRTGLSKGDTWLLSLPMYHVGGLEIVFRTVMAAACAFVPREQSLGDLLALAADSSCSHVSMVPSQLSLLLAQAGGLDFAKNLKLILLGGAAADSRLIAQIEQQQLPVLTSYGMSETTSHITLLDPAQRKNALASSGRVLDGAEIRIINSQGTELPPGEVGEIQLRSKRLFLGYLGESNICEGSWFSTGDLGSLDTNASLSVHGRKDRTIISGGENINLSYIEQVAKDFELVSDCAAIGLFDERWGERPLLFVQFKATEKNNISSLQQYLEEALPRLFWPKSTIELGAIPKTSLGKVDYQKLKGL